MWRNMVQSSRPQFTTLCGGTWYSHPGHSLQHNTAHALCVLDHQDYRHTLRICNTYCFNTAAKVTRTRLNVTVPHVTA